MRTAIVCFLLCTPCFAAESLDSTPVDYNEIWQRAVFCEYATRVTDKEVLEAALWATRYGVVCPKTRTDEARREAEAAKRKAAAGT